jgi:hypothetical protein
VLPNEGSPGDNSRKWNGWIGVRQPIRIMRMRSDYQSSRHSRAIRSNLATPISGEVAVGCIPDSRMEGSKGGSSVTSVSSFISLAPPENLQQDQCLTLDTFGRPRLFPDLWHGILHTMCRLRHHHIMESWLERLRSSSTEQMFFLTAFSRGGL